MEAWLAECIALGRKNQGHSVTVTVTPVLAELLLERNQGNRPVAKRNAAALEQDIASGRFQFNGESIVVSDTGVLLDGQHRCRKVVETGVSIRAVLVFGPKEEARFTIDTGKSKSTANMFAMQERPYFQIQATAIGYILQYKQAKGIARNVNYIPTVADRLAFADEKGIESSIGVIVEAGGLNTAVASAATLAFCHYAFAKRTTKGDADEFITQFITGEGLRRGDPILAARNRCINIGRRIDAGVKANLIFKAWNASRNGETVFRFEASAGKLNAKG
jgi:hypothetical protein